ncbi:MAG: hypothetical protein KAW16_08290 [candidate division Zixibacteria bacterium]|nr:hypothetical protein [candidate division Zixibacteria bacterium]
MIIDEKLLLDIVWLYYIKRQNVSNIAKKLEIHRSKVSKLLDIAREKGIVEFRINAPIEYELSVKVREQFPSLKDAIIVNAPCPLSLSDEENRQVRAQSLVGGGISVLKRIFSALECNSPILAIGGGITIREFTMGLKPELLPLHLFKGLSIIPASMGKAGDFVDISPNTIVGLIKGKLGTKARAYALNVPCLLQNGDEKAHYMERADVKEIFAMMERANVVMAGVGDLQQGSRMYESLKAAGADVEKLRESGAVGDILDQVFDIHGNADKFRAHNDRVLALPLKKLKEMCNSKHQGMLCLAVGPQSKAKAIKGAINGGYIDSLVSDVETVKLLLEE